MNIVIVDAVFTPFVRRNGLLRGWHAVDLAGYVLTSLQERSLPSGHEPDVILGCSMPVGEQALNIARNAVLGVGWNESVAAFTLDGQTSSGQLAVHAAIARVASGMSDVCIGGGIELTSRIPNGASTGNAIGKPFGPSVHQRYASSDGLRPPGMVTEAFVRHFGLHRELLDSYVATSIANAKHSQTTGAQKASVVPTPILSDSGKATNGFVEHDEISNAKVDSLKELDPLFISGGVVTAGNFATPADGACAVLIASSDWCKRNGVMPMARVAAMRERGNNVLVGDTGAELVAELTDKTKLLDRLEVHEDSAATVLALAKKTKFSTKRINPDGGALAYGDPIAASGARLIAVAARAIADGQSRRVLALTAGAASVMAATALEAI